MRKHTRIQETIDLLIEGKSQREIAALRGVEMETARQDITYAVTHMLNELPAITWQHCVALCYSASQYTEFPTPLPCNTSDETTHATVLAAFLRSKDSELAALECELTSLKLTVKERTAHA